MKLTSLVLTTTALISGCSPKIYKVDDFTNEELVWYKPFTRTETVIYLSEKAERDTITFKAPNDTTYTARDIIRGGRSTNRHKTVSYAFSKGSYHQSALMSGGKNRYTQHFVNTSKSSNGHKTVEITFIGTFFSGDNVFPDHNKLNNIQKMDDNTYYFDSRKANYSDLNVEKGIKSFTFNTSLGVTEFVDNRGIKWMRQ